MQNLLHTSGAEQAPKLTIIVPTHERPRRLQRVLASLLLQPHPVIVVDSSQRRHVDVHPRFSYFHVPEMGERKFLFAIQHVVTPYVCFHPDDDFLSKRSLMSSIEFLEHNRSYVSAQGLYLQYSAYARDLVVARRKYPGMIERALTEDFSSSDVLERIERMMRKLTTWVYAIHRTEVLRCAVEVWDELRHPAVTLLEFAVTLSIALHGNWKHLPVVHMLREISHVSTKQRTRLATLMKSEEEQPAMERFAHLLLSHAGPQLGAVGCSSRVGKGDILAGLRLYCESISGANHSGREKEPGGGFVWLRSRTPRVNVLAERFPPSCLGGEEVSASDDFVLDCGRLIRRFYSPEIRIDTLRGISKGQLLREQIAMRLSLLRDTSPNSQKANGERR